MGIEEAERRKRFKGVCPCCDKDIFVCKSLGILIGWTEKGFGSCIHCDSILELSFNDNDDTVEAVKYESVVNDSNE